MSSIHNNTVRAIGMTTLMISAIFLLLIPNSPFVGNAQATTVNTDILSDQTWTAANSPYLVTNNILVDDGITLTIESGVDVQIEPNVAIEVRGNLDVDGTASQPVTFGLSTCLLYTSPSPRDKRQSRMPSSA